MSNEINDLPVFPTAAPLVFCDPDTVPGLFSDVLHRLAEIVDVEQNQLDRSTPCTGFNVGELRAHVLGWLGFFASALSDPAATTVRPDPEAFALDAQTQASEIVERSLDQIRQAITADVAAQLVTMSSSRMAGDGVLAMALGEYIIHGWDLATATGRPYDAPTAAVNPAHEFLKSMVAPDYRGPDSGFFDAEVAVPENASPLVKLLGFAGRDPQWVPRA